MGGPLPRPHRGRRRAASGMKSGSGGKKGPAPQRGLAVTLRTSRKRSPASQRWLKRQLNDPYVQAAQQQGWRSRAAFKLIELDDRFQLITNGRAGDRPRRRARRLDAGRGQAWCGAGGGRGPAGDGPGAGGGDHPGRFHRSGHAGAADRHARRQGGPGAVGHGAEHHRPCGHRPYPHHGAGRAGAAISPSASCAEAAASSPRCSRAAPNGTC